MGDAVRDFMDPSMHYRVVDVGAKTSHDAHLTHRSLFEGYSHDYVGIDVQPGNNVDLVMPGLYTIPVESESADIVVSGQVFEHVPFFWTTFLEMARILKVGGHIFLSAPSRGHTHAHPYDCWRFYPDGFRSLAAFAKLRLVRVHTDFPPRGENKRFDYAAVTPYRYWGDTVGVFRKTEEYDQKALDRFRQPLIDWCNSVGDVDATLAELGPPPLGRGQSPRITHSAFGIDFPFNPALINEKVAEKIKKGRYEIREAVAIQSYLKGGERVLELGGGLGFISTLVSRFKRPASYTVVEADPRLIPVIKETHKLNGVAGVQVEHCVATSDPAALAAGFCTMRIAKTFWGSSIKSQANGGESVLVEAVPLKKFLDNDEPEVLIADIEGGEVDLFTGIEMPSVNLAIIELHPTVTGEDGIARMEAELARIGLHSTNHDPSTRVGVYQRRA